jgi:hypothetical protein
VPNAGFELQNVLWPLVFQTLCAEFVSKHTAGGEAFSTQEVAGDFDCICDVANLTKLSQ